MSYITLQMRVKPIFVIPEKIIVRSQNSISMKGLERLGKLAMSHFEIHYNKESIQDFPKLGRGIKEPRNSSNSVCWLLLLLNFYVFFCACLDHQMWQAGKNIELQRDSYCYGDYTYIQCFVGAQGSSYQMQHCSRPPAHGRVQTGSPSYFTKAASRLGNQTRQGVVGTEQ